MNFSIEYYLNLFRVCQVLCRDLEIPPTVNETSMNIDGELNAPDISNEVMAEIVDTDERGTLGIFICFTWLFINNNCISWIHYTLYIYQLFSVVQPFENTTQNARKKVPLVRLTAKIQPNVWKYIIHENLYGNVMPNVRKILKKFNLPAGETPKVQSEHSD